jgi:hypothetical protein
MLFDSHRNIGNGKLSLDAGIKDSSIKVVISYIREQIELFAQAHVGLTSLNEKGLNQKLCIFLNRSLGGLPFYFHPEFMENPESGLSPQVDIGIISTDEKIEISDRQYNEDDSFFSLEAKRLPAPGGKRKKEYVIGEDTSCGGMERFKKGIHGGKLKYAGLIGFIQENRFDYWITIINSWIDELASNDEEGLWTKKDILTTINYEIGKRSSELFSDNKRIIRGKHHENIQLFHFWVDLVP